MGSGDYHLQAGSPCINMGSNAAPRLPATDYDEDPRIIDGTVDMGLDETHPSVQPDLWIKKGTQWIGDNLYNDDGTGQTVTLTVAPGTAGLYQGRLYNDGNQTATFWIKGPSGDEDWTVRYYTGTEVDPLKEVTAKVTSARGWRHLNVPSGASRRFCFTVTSNSGVTRGRFETLIRAEAQRDSTQRDTLRSVTILE
ncbi:MAG: choice-of-anchor Q domain-containing protein [candidate division WOR-3 bacterium]